MLLLGVPLALPLAILAFLAGFVPYFGGIVTTASSCSSRSRRSVRAPVVLMLVLIGVRNLILGYAVRPALYGRTVKIHPALVLIVLPAGLRSWPAIVGLFAAVPLTAVLLAVAVRDRRHRGAGPTAAAPGPGAGLARPRGPVELAPARGVRARGARGRHPARWCRWSWSRSSWPSSSPRRWDPWSSGSWRAAVRRGRACSHHRGRRVPRHHGAVLVLAMLSLVDQAGGLADGTIAGMRSVNESAGGHLGLPTAARGPGRPSDARAHRHPGPERRDRRRGPPPGHPPDLLPAAGRRPTLGTSHQPRPARRRVRGR